MQRVRSLPCYKLITCSYQPEHRPSGRLSRVAADGNYTAASRYVAEHATGFLTRSMLVNRGCKRGDQKHKQTEQSHNMGSVRLSEA